MTAIPPVIAANPTIIPEKEDQSPLENLTQQTFASYELMSGSGTGQLDNSFAPIPSTTPPRPTLWVRGDGKGRTFLGNLLRVAETAKRWGMDKVYGGVPGVAPELAPRTTKLTSKELLELLTYFRQIYPNFHFSEYLCLNPIQSLDKEALKAHLVTLFAEPTLSEDMFFLFPIYYKTDTFFETGHMTFFLANKGVVEFYDTNGISTLYYPWYDKYTLQNVAFIIQERLYSKRSSPLANFNSHQSDHIMCGLFVAAWINHRVILGKTQKEWITKVENTDDEQIRREVWQLLEKSPKITPQTEVEDDLIFTFDDEVEIEE